MRACLRTFLFVLITGVVSSCAQPQHGIEGKSVATSLRVFALFLDEIVTEDDEIHVLVSDTQSPHAFHPKPSDIEGLSESRILFLGDDHLDGWAESLGQQRIVYLSALLDSSSLIQTSQSVNPHFWMDPRLIGHLREPVVEVLCDLNPSDCDTYRSNAARFLQSLTELEEELGSMLRPLVGQCVFVSQPFFDYFLARFGIRSAGTLDEVPGQESSASHIVDLLEIADASSCLGILAQERLPDTSARLFSQETGLPIRYLDPIGTADVLSYAELLRQNATTLMSLVTQAP